MLHESGRTQEPESIPRPAGASVKPPLPPPGGCQAERIEIAKAVGYPGAACLLTNRAIESEIMKRLDWEE